MNSWIIAIIISTLVTGLLVGGVLLLEHKQIDCEKENVCYKSVGGFLSPNYLEVDCDSENADLTILECIKRLK